jgi:hypothetical protein
MEIGAGLQKKPDGRATDALEAIIRRLRASAGKCPDTPTGCATWAGDDKLPNNRNRPE